MDLDDLEAMARFPPVGRGSKWQQESGGRANTAALDACSDAAFRRFEMTVAAQRAMTAREWGLLALLSLLWGGSYFFVGVAVQEIPPLTLVTLRVGLPRRSSLG